MKVTLQGVFPSASFAKVIEFIDCIDSPIELVEHFSGSHSNTVALVKSIGTLYHVTYGIAQPDPDRIFRRARVNLNAVLKRLSDNPTVKLRQRVAECYLTTSYGLLVILPREVSLSSRTRYKDIYTTFDEMYGLRPLSLKEM